MFHDGKFEDIRQSEYLSTLRDEAGIVTRRNVFLRMLILVTALPMSANLRMRAFAAAINPKAGREFG
jgi:hypothetical protein